MRASRELETIQCAGCGRCRNSHRTAYKAGATCNSIGTENKKNGVTSPGAPPAGSPCPTLEIRHRAAKPAVLHLQILQPLDLLAPNSWPGCATSLGLCRSAGRSAAII